MPYRFIFLIRPWRINEDYDSGMFEMIRNRSIRARTNKGSDLELAVDEIRAVSVSEGRTEAVDLALQLPVNSTSDAAP